LYLYLYTLSLHYAVWRSRIALSSQLVVHMGWQWHHSIYGSLYSCHCHVVGQMCCTLWVKKLRHPTHVDNFAKNGSILKILSLIDSEQNFLQNKYCIAHHTLQMLLHYLVKLYSVSELVYIQKYIIKGRCFEVFLRMYLLNFFFSSN